MSHRTKAFHPPGGGGTFGMCGAGLLGADCFTCPPCPWQANVPPQCGANHTGPHEPPERPLGNRLPW